MWIVTDDFGTKQRAWSRANALAWLRCCSGQAQITNIWGRVVATRNQVCVY